ncbi:MAG: DUF4280 domain-containing protein [Chryseobacterium sp.]|jgi:hypothetical protein|uniref:DUF4280 domain-containing protein n=1 Tax=Chryseobacterium sp. TaxID=1871047 RepID=UPI00282BEDB9|nr:DUF4280 domain-containing protein [Chryseobacterium sp.]MDR2237054.1 DUF4280 domain-containing protein [Chryseobacterium sp.]
MSEKHLVCQGAICKCQFGTAPDKLMVKTQSKRYINDKEGSDKLMATHVDIGATFEKNTFGSCAKMNNNPCTPSVTQWEGYYENITVEDNGGKALQEDSKATCAVSGTPSIEIIFHGQTAEPMQQNVENARPEVVAQLLPVEEDNTEYIYYTKEGLYLGGIEKSAKIYIATQEEYDKVKADKKWSGINIEKSLLKEKEAAITNEKFVEKASTIYGESSAYRGNIEMEAELESEMLAIACVHKINKVAYGVNSKQAVLFRNTKIAERNETKKQLAVAAIIRSLTTDEDPSNGATMWDGAEQAAFPASDDRYSTGKFEIHMNTMGWTISDAHHTKWQTGVERLGATFNAPKEKYTPGKNPNNKYATEGTIALESRAVFLGTIFWKELKTRKKKPAEKKQPTEKKKPNGKKK